MNPVLDKNRPCGDIYGSEGPDGNAPRFFQDGHYFRADGTYLSSEPNARPVAQASQAEVNVPTASAVTDDAEVADLLKHPEADDLLAMDREVIVEMVRQANGPVLSGDSSQRMMAAWLIKNTMPPAPAIEQSEPEPLVPDAEEQASIINPEEAPTVATEEAPAVESESAPQVA